MSALTARILAEAQHAANEVDHEDHDEAVRVALELAAPLIAARALEEQARRARHVVQVGSEVRTRSGAFPSMPYVKQADGTWKPKYEEAGK